MPLPKPRVLLIGWDAADWKVIQPLLQAGEMPNLARLISSGVHGNLATIYPVLSPMLWTSIATGKRAYKHGVHGFTEPAPDGSGVRPVSVLSRKTKAVWNILHQTGHRCLVAGWWPSHPAEPINGVMVSNHFAPPPAKPGEASPPLPGTIHPASLAKSLAELRVNAMELSGEFLRMFVPEYAKVDQAKDKRLHSLARVIAETMSIHGVATELLETQAWDFAAIYYCGLDHFQHGFMRYHPPRLPWVSEEDFAVFQHVIANAYRYHDAMLGTLLASADEKTTVILLSDHGFHPDHLRVGYIPAEPAGPAVEHRHYGIVCLKGPGVRVGEKLFGASLLDICPTVLSLFGLSPGKDMDGKVLVTAFQEAPRVEPIESWDRVAGDAGTHPPDARVDAVASAQAFQQLVELGYVAPPAADARESVAEAMRELKYNLAESYRDGNCCGEAAGLAEELWLRWPREHRFGVLLASCLGPLGQVARRREVIEELGRRVELYQAEAKTELERRGDPDDGQREPAGQPLEPEAVRKRYERRQLLELAQGRPLLMDWLRLSQSLLEKRSEDAREYLEKLKALDPSEALNQRLASALTELGDLEAAREMLEAALEVDPENAQVLAQLAGLHYRAGRMEEAAGAATESLSLLYFQPGVHTLLGQVLLDTGRYAEAEQALRVAVSQTPRNLAGHELLARLYRDHLHRPGDAFAHEGRANSLRQELAARQRAGVTAAPSMAALDLPRTVETPHAAAAGAEIPAPFSPALPREETITVVSGLPRSGTSLMMQLLVAAGWLPLTDGKRLPDEDNPRGYFEWDKARELAKDSAWMPQARGKVVKVVAQLLPFLPAGEHYNVVFMERNLAEVVASQSAMLARQRRPKAELADAQLMQTYATQLRAVWTRLARRSDIRVLCVDYGDLLMNPAAGVARLAEFLGQPFNSAAAVAAVQPQLRRQRA